MNWMWFVGVLLLGWLILTELEKRGKLGAERHAVLFIFRTGRGRDFLSRIAAFKGFWRIFGSIGVMTGVLGMLLMFYSIAFILHTKYVLGIPIEGFKPVIPGVTIPFSYGVIGLITVLLVHEVSHGILALVEDVPLKSSGLVFLSILPIGAFVEPDEEALMKRNRAARLRVYAVGSFGNILLFFLAFSIIYSFQGTFFGEPMVKIVGVMEGSPAEGVLENGMMIKYVNGRAISSDQDFQEATAGIKPNQNINITTDKGAFILTTEPKAEAPTEGFVGIYATEISPPKEGNIKYIYFTLSWIAFLNQGIGLVNLAPLHFGIAATDGHYILKEIISRFIQGANAEKIATLVSTFTLLSVIVAIKNPLELFAIG